MNGSWFKLRWLLVIGASVLGMLALIPVLQWYLSGSGSVLDRVDFVLIAAEQSITGERSEPTPRATPILEAKLKGDLTSVIEELLAAATASQFVSYQEFPESAWPSQVRALKPVAIRYIDSTSHPDGKGVIVVVERIRGWEAGVFFCQQRNDEWQGVHLNGQVMRGGPDFGYRRLAYDGFFWHWYRDTWIAANQPVQRTGASRSGSETNRMSSAAGSRR